MVLSTEAAHKVDRSDDEQTDHTKNFHTYFSLHTAADESHKVDNVNV